MGSKLSVIESLESMPVLHGLSESLAVLRGLISDLHLGSRNSVPDLVVQSIAITYHRKEYLARTVDRATLSRR